MQADVIFSWVPAFLCAFIGQRTWRVFSSRVSLDAVMPYLLFYDEVNVLLSCVLSKDNLLMAITYDKIFFAKGDFLCKLFYLWPYVLLDGEFSKVFIALLSYANWFVCFLYRLVVCLSLWHILPCFECFLLFVLFYNGFHGVLCCLGYFPHQNIKAHTKFRWRLESF